MLESRFQPEQNLSHFQVSNPAANNHSGTSRCKQALEEFRMNQTDGMVIILQQQEEKEQKLMLENQKKEQVLEKSLQQMRKSLQR